MDFLQSVLRWVLDLLNSPNVQATVGEIVATWAITTIPALEGYRDPLIAISGIVYSAFIIAFNAWVQPAALRATNMSFQALQAQGRARGQTKQARPQTVKTGFEDR